MDDVTLYTGDCAQVMAERIETGSIDLTVTSPPYDNLRTYKGYTFDCEAIAQQLWRVTKPGGVVVWVVADATINGSETGTSFRQALYFMGLGFNLHDTMIYEKGGNGAAGSHNAYWQEWESMFVLAKGIPQTFNPLWDRRNVKGRGANARQRRGENVKAERWNNPTHSKRGNVWHYDVGFNCNSKDDEAYQHPAPFPEALARDHIASWSNPGDLVLDPMMGSGTTGKMAVILQRHFIGIDIAAEYVELARQRIGRAQLQPPLITLPDNKEMKLTRGGSRDDLEMSRTEPQWSGSLFPNR